MSKPVKELLRKELARRLQGVSSLAVVGFAGIDGVATNKIRGRLRQKNIKLSVVKNSLARQAFESVGLPWAGKLLDGPSAVVFSADPDRMGLVEVVRELLDIAKAAPNLIVKAAVLEGKSFGADRIKELSRYPTREEAIANAVSCILAPGGKLAACLLGPGGKIASLLKAIEEKAKASEGQAA